MVWVVVPVIFLLGMVVGVGDIVFKMVPFLKMRLAWDDSLKWPIVGGGSGPSSKNNYIFTYPSIT